MAEDEWQDWFSRCVGLRLAGDVIEEVDPRGEPIVGDTFLLLLNAHHEAVPFVLPAPRARVRWELVFDTGSWDFEPRGGRLRAGDVYPLAGRTVAVLRLRRERRP